jgi:hypothetical protein
MDAIRFAMDFSRTLFDHESVWRVLSRTIVPDGNPDIAELMETHINLLDWDWLSTNPGAIEFMAKHQDQISWKALMRNPGIFVYDYAEMKRTRHAAGVMSELLGERFRPEHMDKWADWGFDDMVIRQ